MEIQASIRITEILNEQTTELIPLHGTPQNAKDVVKHDACKKTKRYTSEVCLFITVIYSL